MCVLLVGYSCIRLISHTKVIIKNGIAEGPVSGRIKKLAAVLRELPPANIIKTKIMCVC